MANFVVAVFDTSIVSFGDTFDVADVSAIGIYIATRFHVVNLLATHINIVLSDSRTTSDSQTIVVNYCVTNFYGTVWSQVDVVVQCEFYFCTVTSVSLFNSEVLTTREFHSFTISDVFSCFIGIVSCITSRFNIEAVHSTNAVSTDCHLTSCICRNFDVIAAYNINFTAYRFNVCAISLDSPDII